MQMNQESSSGSLFSLSSNLNIGNTEDNELKKKREEFANEIRTKDRESLLNLKRKAYVFGYIISFARLLHPINNFQ